MKYEAPMPRTAPENLTGLQDPRPQTGATGATGGTPVHTPENIAVDGTQPRLGQLIEGMSLLVSDTETAVHRLHELGVRTCGVSIDFEGPANEPSAGWLGAIAYQLERLSVANKQLHRLLDELDPQL